MVLVIHRVYEWIRILYHYKAMVISITGSGIRVVQTMGIAYLL